MGIKKFTFILVCLLSLIIAACSKEESVKSKLLIGQASATGSLNPLTIKSPETFFVAWQIYEGLLGLDAQGNIIPKIAESWETKDYKIWRFNIRKGVEFQKSEIFETPSMTRTLTAHDVYYAYTRFCTPDSYPSFLISDSIKGYSRFNKGEAKTIEGFKVIDDYTFQIELVAPEPSFLNRISSPWLAIFPKEAENEKYKDKWGISFAVGTGPFILTNKTENEITLTKNPSYWNTSHIAKINTIVFKVVQNDQIRFSNLSKKTIDMMMVPSQLFPTVFDTDGTPKGKYSSEYNFETIKTFNTHLIGVNMKKLTDINLRRAIYYGTNREEMINEILFGYADIIGGAVPPGMNGYTSSFENLYDSDKAKQELKKSKYDGREISLLVHELANSELIGQIFQKQMKDIGINIRLEKQDFNSTIGRMIKGDAELFSMFAEVAFSSPEPLLINLFSSKKIPVPNFWNYSVPEIDMKLEDLKNITDSTKSVKMSEQIDKEIMQTVPAIFLYRQNQVLMFSKKFTNIKVNGHSHFMLEDITTTSN